MLQTSVMRVFSYCLLLSAIVFASFDQTPAQSQANNGQIEGVVTDANGGAIANATVTVRNIETGAERTVTSDESGVYRIPLLP
ncbi:MAG: carboxypeptidase-like regulatory domain-containing protein, partial [Acidobacteriota bacterium]|nr:carboxypeptidase-like regulatory domain-containing protein [Acidobacteriota bacterium]